MALYFIFCSISLISDKFSFIKNSNSAFDQFFDLNLNHRTWVSFFCNVLHVFRDWCWMSYF